MDDELMNDKFRELTMHLERIESDYRLLRLKVDAVDIHIKNLKDELTTPSGKVTQRFAKLETQIQQLSAKPVQ